MDKLKDEILNPHGICSWGSQASCAGCSDSEELNCRFKFKRLFQFYFIFLPFAVPSIIGVYQSGYSIYLWGWAIMALVFFGVWEIYILCSHCPYYALSGFTIKCIANYGCPKFWRYQPGPISKFKKIQLVFGFIIMSVYPFIFMVLGHQLFLFILSLCGLILFFTTLFRFKCTKCINFSCVFNRVPKERIDSYLNRNPEMAEAWKEAGWQIGSTKKS